MFAHESIDVRERVGVVVRRTVKLRFNGKAQRAPIAGQCIGSEQNLEIVAVRIDLDEIDRAVLVRRQEIIEHDVAIRVHGWSARVEHLLGVIDAEQVARADGAHASERIVVLGNNPILPDIRREQAIEIVARHKGRFVLDLRAGHLLLESGGLCHQRFEPDRTEPVPKGLPVVLETSTRAHVDEKEVALAPQALSQHTGRIAGEMFNRSVDMMHCHR